MQIDNNDPIIKACIDELKKLQIQKRPNNWKSIAEYEIEILWKGYAIIPVEDVEATEYFKSKGWNVRI